MPREDGVPYHELRPLMFSIAYRMTGSVSDAEDIVQEAFVGLTRGLGDGTVVEAPKAYLAAATTRHAINHLRSARVRREAYVGAWLPEPLVTGAGGAPHSASGPPGEPPGAPDPAERAELADSLSMAFLVMLESLSPLERAVFLLREVFGYDYGEVARIVGKNEPNCRQIFARARQHIGDRRPRFESSRARGEELARRFFAAAAGGEMSSLLELLSPDVVFYGDGGGKALALREPLHGQLRVARFIAGLFRRGHQIGAQVRPAWVNGQPGGVSFDATGRMINVFALDIADGTVQAIRSVVNPDKLAHLGPVSDMGLRIREDLWVGQFLAEVGGRGGGEVLLGAAADAIDVATAGEEVRAAGGELHVLRAAPAFAPALAVSSVASGVPRRQEAAAPSSQAQP